MGIGDSKAAPAKKQDIEYDVEKHNGDSQARSIHKPHDSLQTGNTLVYGLFVTLSCATDGSKRERELGLKRIPKTVADLQNAIQEQFNIPVFDQKLIFGPTELSTKESLESYCIRNGDHVNVEYSSEADVKSVLDVISYIQKTLAFLQSVEQRLQLTPISQDLDREMRQNINLAELDTMTSIHASQPPTPAKMVVNSKLFIASGGLECLQQLQALLLRLPFKYMTFQTQVLEVSLNRLLWTLASCAEIEAVMLKEIKWDNIYLSLFRVSVIPDKAIVPARNPYTDQFKDVQRDVIIELLTTTMGFLSW